MNTNKTNKIVNLVACAVLNVVLLTLCDFLVTEGSGHWEFGLAAALALVFLSPSGR